MSDEEAMRPKERVSEAGKLREECLNRLGPGLTVPLSFREWAELVKSGPRWDQDTNAAKLIREMRDSS